MKFIGFFLLLSGFIGLAHGRQCYGTIELTEKIYQNNNRRSWRAVSHYFSDSFVFNDPPSLFNDPPSYFMRLNVEGNCCWKTTDKNGRECYHDPRYGGGCFGQVWKGHPYDCL